MNSECWEMISFGIAGFFILAGIGASLGIGFGLMDAIPKWVEKRNQSR